MQTIPREYVTTQGIDPAILNDPELIRKRKEARRNMHCQRWHCRCTS